MHASAVARALTGGSNMLMPRKADSGLLSLLKSIGYSERRQAGKRIVPVMGDRDFYMMDRYASCRDAIAECINQDAPGIATIIPHLVGARGLDWDQRSVLGEIRSALADGGLTKSGWRFLLSLPLQKCLPLTDVVGGREGYSLEPMARRIQAFAEIGVWPEDSFFLDVLLSRNLLDHELTDDVRSARIAVIRSAFAHLNRLDEAQRIEMRPNFVDALDWLDVARPVMDKQRLAASWSTHYRMAAAWHEAEAEAERQRMRELTDRAKGSNFAWPTYLPEFASGTSRAVALCTAKELQQEGEARSICVGNGSYARSCASGLAQIYSIRRLDGAPVATVELSLAGGRWMVVQNRGYKNAPVAPDIARFGKQLAEAYTHAALKRGARPVYTEAALSCSNEVQLSGAMTPAA